MSDIVEAVNHTSFTASGPDFERLISFFTNGLAFRLLSRGPRDADGVQKTTGVEGADIEIAFIQAPGHKIELINYLSPDDRKRHNVRPCDHGFAHLAFDVFDIDAALGVNETYEFKRVYDPIEVSGGPNKGKFCAYTRDPNGITIELIGPRKK
ncbi:VOC family protein (plasmid) [Agrobacterium leguminum]|uniref:Glyoxalase/bleomycin resistance protein/dioxygenase superfamily protein n=1 Tax=Agrobacterium deltaense NCPPB 1641 TaxID=1183425 RepID=A0A1S7UAV7_9HYPH|nr:MULTISPECIES: VOC family protein [Agrobacterium]WFS69724.1 VOC family protein [Agrobacterium leguminum]CVI64024.1 putative glyoxalase/bleomycin resistance protein/dioxygenase superfamily protein [Agrobacterium deltaense NCPPB 1641]